MLVVFVAVALTSAPRQIPTLGSYAVVLTWPPGMNDLDLYVRDPAGAICFFGNMQIDELQLEHDDLGTSATSYGGGKPNEERTVLRGTTTGQYVVNVHLYHRGQGTAPIPAIVSLWDLRGSDRVIQSRTVRVTHAGDERTAFRFTLDARGDVTGYSFVPVSLVQPTTTAGARVAGG
jgi:hypothetical protein